MPFYLLMRDRDTGEVSMLSPRLYKNRGKALDALRDVLARPDAPAPDRSEVLVADIDDAQPVLLLAPSESPVAAEEPAEPEPEPAIEPEPEPAAMPSRSVITPFVIDEGPEYEVFAAEEAAAVVEAESSASPPAGLAETEPGEVAPPAPPAFPEPMAEPGEVPVTEYPVVAEFIAAATAGAVAAEVVDFGQPEDFAAPEPETGGGWAPEPEAVSEPESVPPYPAYTEAVARQAGWEAAGVEAVRPEDVAFVPVVEQQIENADEIEAVDTFDAPAEYVEVVEEVRVAAPVEFEPEVPAAEVVAEEAGGRSGSTPAYEAEAPGASGPDVEPEESFVQSVAAPEPGPAITGPGGDTAFASPDEAVIQDARLDETHEGEGSPPIGEAAAAVAGVAAVETGKRSFFDRFRRSKGKTGKKGAVDAALAAKDAPDVQAGIVADTSAAEPEPATEPADAWPAAPAEPPAPTPEVGEPASTVADGASPQPEAGSTLWYGAVEPTVIEAEVVETPAAETVPSLPTMPETPPGPPEQVPEQPLGIFSGVELPAPAAPVWASPVDAVPPIPEEERRGVGDLMSGAAAAAGFGGGAHEQATDIGSVGITDAWPSDASGESLAPPATAAASGEPSASEAGPAANETSAAWQAPASQVPPAQSAPEPEARPTVPPPAAPFSGYESHHTGLDQYTCDDCVYVETCPQKGEQAPATCGLFQWKA